MKLSNEEDNLPSGGAFVARTLARTARENALRISDTFNYSQHCCS